MPNTQSKKDRIDYKYNLKIYFNLIKKYKALIFFTLIALAIVESSVVIEKFLLKRIIDSGTSFASQKINKEVFLQIAKNTTIVFAITITIKAISDWTYLHFLNRLESSSIADLKRKFFYHLVNLSHNFHTSSKTGSLISRLIRGGSAMEKMTDVIIFNFTPLFFQSIASSVALFYVDRFSIIIILSTVVCFVGFSLSLQSSQNKTRVIANNTEDVEKANISDVFTNIDSIKYFGKEATIKQHFDQLSEKTKIAMRKNWDYFNWIKVGQDLILGTGTFFLIYFPLVDFLNGKTTIGTVVFIYTIFGNLLAPMFSFVHGMKNLYTSMADFESLFQYGKIINEIKDKPNAKNLKIKTGKVEFKNISFKYHKTDLFKNFNLIVEPNQKVALVGHSGSGKSTLVKLLYRFYDIHSGEILIDEKNIKDVAQESLRSEMSIVPQECILFDDTIYNNIAFSNPNASRTEVINAMKFAQLYNIVQTFPYQENTIVGERGIKLSGGEKQRVSIARAILANKKILVLDEATSALDSRTEYEIKQDLEKLMKNRTSIIIAHRLSTIMKADKIVVLKDGQIVQSGSHQELINQEGEYKHLWNLQKDGYILN